MTAARAGRRMRLKGRSIVAVGLLAFVAVTSLVIWRRSVGVSTAKAMQRALAKKSALEADRITLQRDVRNAQMMQNVVAEAERRLGLHVASETQSRLVVESGKTP